ncbi:alpha/beta fold hydrolase [Pseudofulvibacter geojedonensis]|uniref:Alpha/beta fold hydrolase n=1 Tax=Pseudofulvibacter geojedonensis TaxID=1123758 RepID=A0ABW3HYX4_9FLAO
MKSILLLHGALGSTSQLKTLKKLLSNQYNVHSFSFEGHGGIPSSHKFSIDLFTQNIVDYLKSHQLDKVSIFGYSMGGYVALNLAKNYPDLVDKIVTLGTKFNWSEESAAKEVKMLNPDKIEAKVPVFANYLEKLHEPNNWKEVLAKTADLMFGLSRGKKFNSEDFKSINHNVLLTVGDKDTMVTQEETLQVSGWLPNSEFKLLKGVEHPIEKLDIEMMEKLIDGYFQ